MLKLDINLLWTVVNVLIMYALLRKFLFKPVQDVLDKRQKMVDDELANAQDAKTRAEAALAAANDKLHNVDVEAAARREESAQQAEKQKEQLLAEAQRILDRMTKEGFIECVSDMNGTWKVLSSWDYLTKMIHSINIKNEDEISQ